jgi:hypothetical protein
MVGLLVCQSDWTVASTYATKPKLLPGETSSASSAETAGRVARHDAPACQLSASTALCTRRSARGIREVRLRGEITAESVATELMR